MIHHEKLLAAAALAAASLALSACGGSASATVGSSSPELNTKKAEQAIAKAVLDQQKVKVTVSCPANVAMKKGGTFTCSAKGTNAKGDFIVTQTDDKGNIHFEGK